MTAASWEQRKVDRKAADAARKETHRQQREARKHGTETR